MSQLMSTDPDRAELPAGLLSIVCDNSKLLSVLYGIYEKDRTIV